MIIFWIFTTVLASAIWASNRGEIVAIHPVDNCKKDTLMECIFPAKLACSQFCMEKNGGSFCARCEIKLETQVKTRGEIVAIQPSGSMIQCYNGYKLHRSVPDWTRDKLFDFCGTPKYIQEGYYLIINANHSAVTFSEASKCTGKPNCPKKPYWSNDISMLLERNGNGKYDWKDDEQSTRSSGVSRATILYSTSFLVLVLPSVMH